MAPCPLVTREGPYLLTCCLPAGHDGCCWCKRAPQPRRKGDDGMTTRHCLVCSHPIDHHVDPTDHLFATPSIEVHGCHINSEFMTQGGLT